MPTRSNVRFTVKEYASGKPWILVEQLRGNLELTGSLGLDLRDGTTYDLARDIARYLNDHIAAISHTL